VAPNSYMHCARGGALLFSASDTVLGSLMTATYSIVLRPEPEGGFTVRVPAFPEIVTFGVEEADAVAMAKEAIDLVIESRNERGEPLPRFIHSS
jgi:antitoxin HicB